MPIRAITFDYWGPLFRDVQSDVRQRIRLAALVVASGAAPELAEQALNDTAREFMRVHIGEQRTLTPNDAVRMVAAQLGVTFDAAAAAELADIFATAIVAYPPVAIDGAFEAVRAAAERYPIAIISDTGISPGSSLTQVMDREGFTPYFQCLTFSDQVGVAKPQAPMFERTAAALGVAADELVHIGDLEPTDIAGAHGVGARAGLFAGVNARFVGNTRAEHTFMRWSEFVALLPGL
jgi:putative hydrolase of the HAD superfamily